jgi:TrmH family RNA methyltransferase
MNEPLVPQPEDDVSGFFNLRDRDLRAEGLCVAEGRLLVERAIDSGCAVTLIVAGESAADEAAALADRASSRDPAPGAPVLLRICSPAVIDRIAGFAFHRGMLAVVRRPLLRDSSAIGVPGSVASPGAVLALPSITDPGNLGTLLRSALAFGFHTVLVGDKTCDPFNRKAMRASMGAVFSLDIQTAEPADLARYAASGIPVYAAELVPGALEAGSEPVGSGGFVLVLGNEFEGIPPEWRKSCTASVEIPVSGAVDSLNVSIAGSILMWESARRMPAGR